MSLHVTADAWEFLPRDSSRSSLWIPAKSMPAEEVFGFTRVKQNVIPEEAAALSELGKPAARRPRNPYDEALFGTFPTMQLTLMPAQPSLRLHGSRDSSSLSSFGHAVDCSFQDSTPIRKGVIFSRSGALVIPQA